MKGKQLKPQGLGAWAGGHPSGKRRADGGASSDLLLGVQVVGVAALLTAGDRVGVQGALWRTILPQLYFWSSLGRGGSMRPPQVKPQGQGGLFLGIVV